MNRIPIMWVGALAIVVMAFLITTYVLDYWLPPAKGENLLWPSENFANPKWSHYQVSIEPSAGKAPNGENSASRLVESTDNGSHFIYTNVAGAAPGAIHTLSIYFKPSDRSLWFEMRDSTPGKYGTALCNLPKSGAGGSVTKAGDVVDGAVEDVGNGWYRCWAAMPYSLATVVLGIELLNQNGAPKYQGDGHSGALIWGAQFEPGGRPTAYLSTTTGPAVKAD